MSSDKTYKLYALYDPRALNDIRYVGITSRRLTTRLGAHLVEARNNNQTHKARWIRKLLEENVNPHIELLDVLPTWEAACTAEIKIIAQLKELGFSLTNLTTGGEGSPGIKRPKEVIAKIQAGRKGYKESEESKKKRSEKLKGRPLKEETKLKMSQARKGKVSKLRQPIKDSLGRTYVSLFDAATQLNISSGGISNVLKGKARSAGGLVFSYIKTGEV
jgi:hypothetical protein